MSDARELPRETDDTLRERFATLRATDARVAPAFGAMLAQARRASPRVAAPVDHAMVARVAGVSPIARTPRRWRRVAWLTAGPLLTAAGFAGVWFNAERQADREFEHLVTEWTHTENQALRSPTDGLLVLPGNEYLRSVPSVGRNIRHPRSGS